MLTHYLNGLVLLLSSHGEIVDFADTGFLIEGKKIATDTIISLIKNNKSNTLSTLNPIVYNSNSEAYTIYPLETYDRKLGYLCIVENLRKLIETIIILKFPMKLYLL